MFKKQFIFIVTISVATEASTFIDKLSKNVNRYKQNNFQWNVRNFDDNNVSLRKLEDEKDKQFNEYLEHLGSKSHGNALDVVKSLHFNKLIQQRNAAERNALPVESRFVDNKRQPSREQSSELNVPQVMCSECDDSVNEQPEDTPQSMMYSNKVNVANQPRNVMMYNARLPPQTMMYNALPDTPQSMMYGNKVNVANQPRNVMMYNERLQPQTMMYNARLPPQTMMYNALPDTPQSMMYSNKVNVANQPRNVMMYNARLPPQTMMYNALADIPQSMMYSNKVNEVKYPRNIMMYNAKEDIPQTMMYSNKVNTLEISETPQDMRYKRDSAQSPQAMQVMFYNALDDTPLTMLYSDKVNVVKHPRNVMMYNALEDTPRNLMMYNALEDTPRNVMMYNALEDTPRNVMMYNALEDTPRNVMMYNALDDTPRNVMMYNALEDTPRNVMMYNALEDTPRNVMMYNAIEDTPRNVMMYNALEDTPRNVMMYNALEDTPRNVMMYNALEDTPQTMMYNALEDTPRNVMMYNALEDTPRNVMMYNALEDTPQTMMYNALKDTPRNVMMYNALEDTPRNVMMYNALDDTPRNVMMYNALEDTPRNVMMYNAKEDTPQTMMYNAVPQTMMYNKPNVLEEEYSSLPNVMLSVERLSQPMNPLSMKYSNEITDIDRPDNVMMYKAIENIPQTMLYSGHKDILVGRRNVIPTLRNTKVQTASNDRRRLYKTVAALVKNVPKDDAEYFNKWSETIALFGANQTTRAQFKSTFPVQPIDKVINNLGSVTMFEKLFWPFVYENGFMNQKLGLLGLSGESPSSQDQKLAFYEALERYQQLRIPVSSDKIVLSFNEEFVVDGLNRSGLMETTKQYVDAGLHLYTPEEERIILRRVNDALHLINDSMPQLYKTISQVMACFAYYKAENPGFAGGSISSALGLTWQDPRVYNEQSVAHYAEQIVHEFIHNSLFLADMVQGTFVNAKLTSQAKVYSPIRHKLRDFDKTFHASYVSTGVSLFHARAGNYEKAKKLLEPLRTSVAGLVEINDQVGVLNESGNAMLQSMVDFLTVIRFL